MTATSLESQRMTKDARFAVGAATLGWAMDAFDYFLVVLVYADIAKEFDVSLTQMAYLTTATLIMRPVGAAIFGMWADRKGRRIPLLVDVSFYSVVGFLCAFAPNYSVLFVLRLLYGIGMGGEWGLGAALAMEKVPAHRRGFISGLLQQGYAIGYMMAAVTFLLVRNFTDWGWRGLFAFSLVPALVSLFFRSRVKESELWTKSQEDQLRNRTTLRQIFSDAKVVRRLCYLIALMTLFNWMSHGTQDLYPTFLKKGLEFNPNTALYIAILYNIGAVLGGLFWGSMSERIGRRRTISICAVLGLGALPLFATSHTIVAICFGSFLMQFMVQGAWGVVPAHLTELSPPEIRGLYPGVTYQLGNCIAAFNLPIQEALAEAHSYSYAIVATVIPVFSLLAILALFGTEARGQALRSSSVETPPVREHALRETAPPAV